MGNKAFHFKQFKVEQDRCAMKIGTDAVLMGALLNFDSKVKNALEVGSGTGVISLMLAQRYPKLEIQSIEIDVDAQAQCEQNFNTSPWSNRLKSTQADLLTFQSETAFDLVFSNPPYFSKSLLSESEQRNIARHIDEEQFVLWLQKMDSLIAENGLLALVIPAENLERISLVLEDKYRIESNVFIRSFPETEVIRNIVVFRKSQHLGSFNIKSMSIYAEKDVYSAEYEFALKHYLTIF